MSIPISSPYHYRLQILAEAGNYVYSQSGEFFDSIRSISDIDLTELGFGGERSIDDITVKDVAIKISDLLTDTSKKIKKSTLEQYDKLKKYIQLKDLIEKLNLPEEVKSIKDRDDRDDRAEYQKAVLYHFIITRWEQYINGSNERLVNSINALNIRLTPREKETYANNIQWKVINEIEDKCKTNLKFKFGLNSELGGSIRKRKYNSRRRPSRKSSAIKRRRPRRPHRRTSRK